MKFFFSILLFGAILLTASCKKNDLEASTPVLKPKSSFNTFVYDIAFKDKMQTSITALDSPFYFRNTSDAGTDISYNWNFGDGTSSQAKEPSHNYAKAGRFPVTLITKRANGARFSSDTSHTVVSVILGQRELSFGKTINTLATNIVETNDNGYLILGTTYDAKIFPYVISTFIMKVDAKFKQQSLKNFPLSTQLNGVTTCGDGNFVFTGTTTGNTVKKELVKITADGTVLWTKTMNTDGLLNVNQTPDNGFILTAIRNVTDSWGNKYPKALVIKTDDAGNVQWEKFFGNDLALEQTFNTVIENDGYTIAGGKAYNVNNGYCDKCDSVAIVKLTTSGNTQWIKTHKLGVYYSGIGPVYLSKMPSGTYNVTSRGMPGMWQFSSSGNFLNFIEVQRAWLNSSTVDGTAVLLQWSSGNGFSSEILGYSSGNVSGWKVGVNSRATLPNYVFLGTTDSWPVAVLPLKAGGLVFVSNNVTPSDSHYSIQLVKVDKDGNVQ